MTDLDLAYLPAATMAGLVAAGDVSPVELVDNALARIDDVNGALNAFAFVWDDARIAANAAADAVAAGQPLGPLHGVPIALKDTTPTAGRTTTFGSYCFEHFIPEVDASIALSLERSGAIVVGKTTSPEFAHSLLTDSPLWGPTRNPWNTDRTPGGSSGGSGAAVASGCVPLAEGSDMGGSVRIPAGWCGVVGLKPGIGRIPMDALPALFDSISHHGPLARTVDDARLFLHATQGPNDADIQSQVQPLDLADSLRTDLRGVRVALSVGLGAYAVEPGVERAVLAAADALTEAGATVVPVNPGMRGTFEDDWDRLWEVFMAAYFGDLVPEFEDRMTPSVLALIRKGQQMSAVEYKRIEFARTEFWGLLRPILADADVLMTATMSSTPPGARLAEFEAPAPRADGLSASADMTAIWNLAPQCPVISVPVGFDDDGLPVGVQLVGQRWRSDHLLGIAAALEAVVSPLGRPAI